MPVLPQRKPTMRTIKRVPAHTDDDDPPPLSASRLLKFLSPSRRHHVKQKTHALNLTQVSVDIVEHLTFLS
jgi:hypothetical protein